MWSEFQYTSTRETTAGWPTGLTFFLTVVAPVLTSSRRSENVTRWTGQRASLPCFHHFDSRARNKTGHEGKSLAWAHPKGLLCPLVVGSGSLKTRRSSPNVRRAVRPAAAASGHRREGVRHTTTWLHKSTTSRSSTESGTRLVTAPTQGSLPALSLSTRAQLSGPVNQAHDWLMRTARRLWSDTP